MWDRGDGGRWGKWQGGEVDIPLRLVLELELMLVLELVLLE